MPKEDASPEYLDEMLQECGTYMSMLTTWRSIASQVPEKLLKHRKIAGVKAVRGDMGRVIERAAKLDGKFKSLELMVAKAKGAAKHDAKKAEPETPETVIIPTSSAAWTALHAQRSQMESLRYGETLLDERPGKLSPPS